MQTIFGSLRTLAREHDELPAFKAAYLVVAFIIAAMFNMGAFALLIAAHMALDIVKYRDVHGCGLMKTVVGVLRESLLDLMLLSLGLFFAVTFHHSVAMAGLSGLLRAEITLIGGFGTVIPKFEILHHFVQTILHLHAHFVSAHERIGKRLSMGELICVLLIFGSVTALWMMPTFLHIEPSVVEQILLWEIIPWRI